MRFDAHQGLVTRDPLDALLERPEGAVLALIAGVEGPSYRPVGAAMVVFDAVDRAGTLSSGCIESDIALHALRVRESGTPEVIRYGRGSPYIDIQLPCGGGLDILLLPEPEIAVLAEVVRRRAARMPCTLEIDTTTGTMRLADGGGTGRDGQILRIHYRPDIRFLVFGKGPEAATFAALVQSAGYPNLLVSPDDETRQQAEAAGCATRPLTVQAYPPDLEADDRTAIILFFHDHDWEPPLLMGAVETEAFYIGSQGSQRARDVRLLALEAMGMGDAQRARLHGPVGLIPSARDAGTLAVSVLAEILAKAMASPPSPAKGNREPLTHEAR
ncbi:MAG: XdhC family protein [Pseudomonadota bacterium]